MAAFLLEQRILLFQDSLVLLQVANSWLTSPFLMVVSSWYSTRL